MKKYIYSKDYVKGEETVTERVIVETDGFGSIDNFMITGLIGENYGDLVADGLAFKMGDSATIAEMVKTAEICKANLLCYENGAVVENETFDFTKESGGVEDGGEDAGGNAEEGVAGEEQA